MTRADVLTAVGILTLGGLLLPGVIEANSESANKTKCANNLRQLGLAALQYSDDKRFMPHNNRILTLDGDFTTNHTPKIARALVWYGYHDNPEGFVCPSSDDRALSISDNDVRENMRNWFWGRKYKNSSKTQSPFIQGKDPTLSQTTELSFGWTRKGMNRNVRSTAILGADRGVRDGTKAYGNHVDGWNVLMADGTVDFFRVTDQGKRGVGDVGAYLSGTNRGQGYLAIRAQRADAILKLKPKAAPKTPWVGYYTDGTVVVELERKTWDPYRKSLTFRGVLTRGTHRFAMYGTAHAAELRGTMDSGKREMPLTIQFAPTGITISSEGLKRTLTKKTHPREKLIKTFMKGMRAQDQATVESTMSKEWLRKARRRPGAAWFQTFLTQWNRLSPRGQARFERQLQRAKVVYEAGKPKLRPR